MRLSGENPSVRLAILALLFTVGCSKESTPGKPAHAKEPEAPAASAPPPAASVSAKPAASAPKPQKDGPLTIETDAGAFNGVDYCQAVVARLLG